MNSESDDTVVAEIRAVRRELADRFGGDVNALCDFLAQQEVEHESRLVTRQPRSPEYARTAAAGRK
jgi:hypothetical protein